MKNTDSTLKTLLRSRSKFLSFLKQQVGDSEVAEDILQQAYVRVTQQTLRKEESVVPWFYRILRRLCIDYYRSRAARLRRDNASGRESRIGQEKQIAAQRAHVRLCGCFEA